MKIKRNTKGFTLIELLIVVAIIGILAAIAIPNYMSYTKRAKMGEVVHAMGAIKNAVVVYYSENPTLPTAGSADLIKSHYGVDLPTTKASYGFDPSTRIITASTLLPDSSGTATLSGNLTLTADEQYKNWTWGGTVESTYKPK